MATDSSANEVRAQLENIIDTMEQVYLEMLMEQREEAAEVLLSEMQKHDDMMNEVLDQAVHWFYSVRGWADLVPYEESLYYAVERLLIQEGRDLDLPEW